jgi:hypothetical protein
MFYEIVPSKAYRCETCGYMKYPGTENNTTEGGPGSHRRMSKGDKKRMWPVVKHLVEVGYTNQEIQDTTNFPRSYVEDMGKRARKELRVGG